MYILWSYCHHVKAETCSELKPDLHTHDCVLWNQETPMERTEHMMAKNTWSVTWYEILMLAHDSEMQSSIYPWYLTITWTQNCEKRHFFCLSRWQGWGGGRWHKPVRASWRPPSCIRRAWSCRRRPGKPPPTETLWGPGTNKWRTDDKLDFIRSRLINYVRIYLVKSPYKVLGKGSRNF